MAIRTAKSALNKLFRGKENREVITIVSGLPRSGTSMMMEMLEAGGMPILTDGVRKADNDNPRGYREFEKVKQVGEDASWVSTCHGKAFKMVSALLHHLPGDKRYKVIFMNRNMEEVLASQRVMLDKRGQQDAFSDQEMAERFEKHLGKVKAWLSRQVNMSVLQVNYNDVIRNPRENAVRVSRFLGNRLDAGKMAHVVEGSLYRQRK